MKTEISNTLILQAHKEACNKWKELIEKECPSLFPKIELNSWWFNYLDEYKNIRHQVFRVVKIEGGRIYGEDYLGKPSSSSLEDFLNKNRLATKEEIESHLIKIWESKGGTGANFKCISSPSLTVTLRSSQKNKFFYEMESDELWYGTKENANCCYSNGNWATILPSQPIEVTLEEIAKLKGVDVSLIKIVK